MPVDTASTKEAINMTSRTPLGSKHHLTPQLHHQPATTIPPNTRCLRLSITHGKHFVNELATSSEAPSHDSYYQLSVQYANQRYSSQLVPATVDPTFDFTCTIPLQPIAAAQHDKPQVMLTLPQCLKLSNTPIHLTLTHYTYNTGTHSYETHLLATTQLEWRYALVHGKLNVSGLQLYSRDDYHTALGMLWLTFDVVPLKAPAEEKELQLVPVYVEQQHVKQHLQQEAQQSLQVQQHFNSYVKAYYNEYRQVNLQCKQRVLRLFAQSESGSRLTARHDSQHAGSANDVTQYLPSHSDQFVCTYVQPIQAARGIHSPSLALRYVKLLPHRVDTKLGGQYNDIWYHPHTIMSCGYASSDNKHLLLCSMLLGFSLDAWVVCGNQRQDDKYADQTIYVVVRVDHNQLVLFDACTGQKHDIESGQPHNAHTLPLQRIYSVFNHHRYYANCSAHDAVHAIHYNFEDESQWKAVNKQAIQLLPRAQAITLQSASIQQSPWASVEQTLESSVMQLIKSYRTEVGKLPTAYDSQLCYALQSQLHTYETERLLGQKLSAAEFQWSVKQLVPLSYTLSAIPLHCVLNKAICITLKVAADALFDAILQNVSAAALLNDSAYGNCYGLSLTGTAYAEGVISVWMMIACIGRSAATG